MCGFFNMCVCVCVCVCGFCNVWVCVCIQNSIREEIKSRMRSGKACYHSVQNLLSSSLLSRKLKFKIYRTVILPVVL